MARRTSVGGIGGIGKGDMTHRPLKVKTHALPFRRISLCAGDNGENTELKAKIRGKRAMAPLGLICRHRGAWSSFNFLRMVLGTVSPLKPFPAFNKEEGLESLESLSTCEALAPDGAAQFWGKHKKCRSKAFSV
ncbi:hypothetical protein NL676_029273 [Syzygium grande]|nr:hypothetical protein NL676_029273 [Syzygium grande]